MGRVVGQKSVLDTDKGYYCTFLCNVLLMPLPRTPFIACKIAQYIFPTTPFIALKNIGNIL